MKDAGRLSYCNPLYNHIKLFFKRYPVTYFRNLKPNSDTAEQCNFGSDF